MAYIGAKKSLLKRPSFRRLAAAAAVALSLGATSSANAANIVLNNVGGVTPGSDAAIGFSKAAAFWSHMLTNNVTINLNVGYGPLGAGILGSTSSPRVGVFTEDVEALLAANANKSALDVQAVANMPTLDANGALSVITSGYKNAAKQGVDTTTKLLDADGSANNYGLALTRANAKALGFTGLTGADATITFSSSFSFDFDPTNGIANNSYDFLGIAIHEIGHALGFVSGVDTYDSFGPGGPNAANTSNLNNFVINSALDLFRYSADSTNLAPGGAYLDWSAGGTPTYFSLDKGATAVSLGGLTGNYSTGQYSGDGRQASHWKDNTYAGGVNCSNPTKTPIGILDPTAGRCESLGITAMDLAAYDAMGWNLAVDVFDRPDIFLSTASLFVDPTDVPEPVGLALFGVALAGLAASRRRKNAGAEQQ